MTRTGIAPTFIEKTQQPVMKKFGNPVVSLLKLKFLTNGVGHEARGDGDSPAEHEGGGHAGVSSQQHGLQGVVQAKVHTSVIYGIISLLRIR